MGVEDRVGASVFNLMLFDNLHSVTTTNMLSLILMIIVLNSNIFFADEVVEGLGEDIDYENVEDSEEENDDYDDENDDYDDYGTCGADDDDEDEEEDDEDDYDDYDLSDYDGNIEDLDYNELKEIEKKLNDISLDPTPTDSDDNIKMYEKMKRMRASLNGLVDKDELKDIVDEEKVNEYIKSE